MATKDELTQQAARLVSAAAKQAFGEWVSKVGDWKIFATVTLRDPESSGKRGTHSKPGWAAAMKASHQLIRLTEATQWCLVFEQHKERGVPHIHALLDSSWAIGEIDRLNSRFTDSATAARVIDCQEVLYGYTGISRLKAYEAYRGADHYIGKYLRKEDSYLTMGTRSPGDKPAFW